MLRETLSGQDGHTLGIMETSQVREDSPGNRGDVPDKRKYLRN